VWLKIGDAIVASSCGMLLGFVRSAIIKRGKLTRVFVVPVKEV
jgi:hypothetical protein